MKLKFILALLIPLTFGSTVRAVDGVIDAVTNEPALINPIPETPESKPADIENTVTSSTSPSDLGMSQSMGDSSNLSAEDSATTMTWPAIPGESLNDIARLFYPKNKIMRQQFVAETLALNTDIEPKLKASNEFDAPTLLQIPTLKSLSQKVSAIKAKRAKAKRQKMQMSYNINKAVSKLPAFLLQEYEALLSKNAFLKAELERLHIRLGILQDKFNDLKLVFDKTMSFPATPATPSNDIVPSIADNPPVAEAVAAVKVTEAQADVTASQTKKVFKNLNEVSKAVVIAPTESVVQPTPEPSNKPVFDWFKYGLLVILASMFVVSGIAYLIRRNRQRMLARLREAMPNMEDTVTHYGDQWQDTEQETEFVVEQKPSEPKKAFLDTEMEKASSTLEEAKLLMSINRTQDAIAHLKLTIETQPKSSINHWLYLLEIFRKINSKEAFEQYAKSLHQTFNVMTPVWYENELATTNAAIVVSQHLEDFPHIIEKLDAVWPSELASVYLRSLITDNRDGERTGFSKSVLDEILMLIALLDTRKEIA